MIKNNKAVVLFSGGIDSTYLIYDFLHLGYEVYPLTFFPAKGTTARAKQLEQAVKARNWLKKNCENPENLHEIHDYSYNKVMVGDEVLGRHLLMLGVAIQYALEVKAFRVGIGVFETDDQQGPEVFPDTTLWFMGAYRAAVRLSQTPVYLETLSGLDRVDMYHTLEQDYNLLHSFFQATSSCFNDSEAPMGDNSGMRGCGICAKCKDNLEAYKMYLESKND